MNNLAARAENVPGMVEVSNRQHGRKLAECLSWNTAIPEIGMNQLIGDTDQLGTRLWFPLTEHATQLEQDWEDVEWPANLERSPPFRHANAGHRDELSPFVNYAYGNAITVNAFRPGSDITT